eukprot:1158233-Pelagomonas_calceolata.AAC.7
MLALVFLLAQPPKACLPTVVNSLLKSKGRGISCWMAATSCNIVRTCLCVKWKGLGGVWQVSVHTQVNRHASRVADAHIALNCNLYHLTSHTVQ